MSITDAGGDLRPPDVALIDSYRRGDAGAFDLLFRRHQGRVRLICLRYVSDDVVADDLVQETFFHLLRALDRIDQTFNVAGWINRIAANVCQDELRRRSRRAAHHDTGDPEEQMLQLADPDTRGEPERALELAHLRQLVWDVAKKLPERQRMVLTLRELQGLSYASIARVMNISEAAVETLLHRARRRFREEYMLLESPPEDAGPCARVAQLLAAIGTGHLRAAQRDLVTEHLGSCAWCRNQHGGPNRLADREPAAQGGSPIRLRGRGSRAQPLAAAR